MSTRAAAALAIAAAFLATPGCHERRSVTAAGAGAFPIGTYRGVAVGDDGKSQRFRLLLWAALPDRIHAELLGPVGGPEVILDGGGGRLSVTLVRERTAYVGAASLEAMQSVTGIGIRLEDLVRWIVSGAEEVPAGIEVERGADEGAAALPRTLEIREGGRRVRIERKRLEAIDALSPGTGTGAPPPGVAEKPIEDLPGTVWPGAGDARPEES